MTQVAIDLGGTYTDFAMRDPATGAVPVWKVPTSSSAPARAVLDRLRVRRDERSLAVGAVRALLHATNPAHERRFAALLREAMPGKVVSLSSDLSPRLREYERTSTRPARTRVPRTRGR